MSVDVFRTLTLTTQSSSIKTSFVEKKHCEKFTNTRSAPLHSL